jgi:hypothetical protein
MLIFAVASGTSASCAAALGESFDKPVRESVADLGPSPFLMPNSPSHIQLSCSYYPDFMVKELDDPGQKGTRWVTIEPILDGHTPKCHLWHDSTERFLAKEWWSFIGVKGPLLFLEAADGDENQGMPFRILDLKTGKGVFEDSERWDGHLEFEPNPDGEVSLKYLRVVGGDCSIPKDGMSCWRKFRRHYGLALTNVPNCSGYRQPGKKQWVVGDQGLPPEDVKTASAIAYPVVVELLPQPSIQPVPGPVQCWAE